jgi:formylglycine-generating enzyme
MYRIPFAKDQHLVEAFSAQATKESLVSEPDRRHSRSVLESRLRGAERRRWRCRWRCRPRLPLTVAPESTTLGNVMRNDARRSAAGALAACLALIACAAVPAKPSKANGRAPATAGRPVASPDAPPPPDPAAAPAVKSVGCLSNADCSGATPSCNTARSVCETPPSCAGLAATCGPNGNGDCCASNVVTGVTTASFYRSYDGLTAGYYTSQSYTAQVSDFRLDTYEVTVGRFRKFVAAYSQTMIAAGAGKNSNNPSDTGWSTAWNTSLDASSDALATALMCQPRYQTWTDAAGSAAAESLPIDCINWFEAEAFCIWDGGRLPTEAEWNYAAAGGTQQRVYPWGSAAPDCSYANFDNSPSCVAPPNGAVNRVGSESPKGNGLYGQADLAGNVWEWVQDWYVSLYTNPCDNCTNLTVSSNRVIRGGGFGGDASRLLSSSRTGVAPSYRFHANGVRCARSK